jgi:hypothetical protein
MGLGELLCREALMYHGVYVLGWLGYGRPSWGQFVIGKHWRPAELYGAQPCVPATRQGNLSVCRVIKKVGR